MLTRTNQHFIFLFSLCKVPCFIFETNFLERTKTWDTLTYALQAMSTSTPQRRLTVAQMYFYSELRSSLGNKVAERWLSGTSAACADPRQVSSVANTPTAQLPTERHKNDQLKRSSSIQDFRSQCQASTRIPAADTPRSLRRHECDMVRLINDHGEKAGLLFTDAAHELLDYSSLSHSEYESDPTLCPVVSCASPRNHTFASSPVSSHSEYESDPSLCHVASWCWSTRRNSASNDDCSSR